MVDTTGKTRVNAQGSLKKTLFQRGKFWFPCATPLGMVDNQSKNRFFFLPHHKQYPIRIFPAGFQFWLSPTYSLYTVVFYRPSGTVCWHSSVLITRHCVPSGASAWRPHRWRRHPLEQAGLRTYRVCKWQGGLRG